MISRHNLYSYVGQAVVLSFVACSLVGITQPANAQVLTGTTRNFVPLCSLNGSIALDDNNDCTDGGYEFPDGFEVGNADFDDAFNSTVFSGGTVSFNSVTTAFGGGTATFNNPVSFVGSSATFSTPTTFNNPATFNQAITTTQIVNTGNISTAGLNASVAVIPTLTAFSTTVTSSLTANAGANINMGGNQIHNVAAGTAGTDAVNVAQLTAATAGIATDVTALETTTATHTTQISALETTTATHTTQIGAIQTVNATQATQIGAIQTVNATQATQITALQAADTVLDTRIDALELMAEGLDERIGKVDDRASAGTAAAVALSGAMFLPGKTFNLTANVGSYRGAHAAALQFGALVSDNVAINAGIGHGFNKGGKTAIRAGFTLGW